MLRLETLLAVLRARRRFALVAAMCALVLTGGSAGATTKLSVSSWAPPGHLIREGLVAWCDELAIRSRGDLQCELLDVSVAPPGQTAEAVARGAVDLGIVIHSLSPDDFVLTRLAELPFVAPSAESASAAFWAIWRQHLRQRTRLPGLRVLTVFTQSAGQLCTMGSPVRRIGDLAGLRLRAGGGVASQVLDEMSAFGARRSFVPLPASANAVADHLLDGSLVTADNIVRYGLQDVVQQCLRVPGGFYRHGFSLVMNEQIRARLSGAQQKLLGQVSDEVAARIFGRAADRLDATLTAHLQDRGVVFDSLSARDLKTLRKTVRPVTSAWITAARAHGLANAASVYRQFQEAVTMAGKLAPAPPVMPAD